MFRKGMGFKHYTALGIPKGSTTGEVAKRFRKLAMAHHPDKGGDPERFKEIQEAYEVLSNPEKKQAYDRWGDGGEPQQRSFYRERPRKKISPPLVHTFRLSHSDMFKGLHKKLKITTSSVCKECLQSCTRCGGSGRAQREVRMGPFSHIVLDTCPKCLGGGEIPMSMGGCVCQGNGKVSSKEQVSIDIPSGIRNHSKIVLEGKGNEVLGHARGDVVVTVEVAKEEKGPGFTRTLDGGDFHYLLHVGLEETLAGCDFEIPHPSGEDVLLTTRGTPGHASIGRAPLSPFVKRRIHGRGAPSANGSRGDMYVQVVPRYEDYDTTALPKEELGKMFHKCVIGGNT